MAINKYREERLHAKNRLDAVASEMAALERVQSEGRVRLRELEREITDQEKRMIELKQSYEQEKTRLDVQKEADYLTFKAAYSLGAEVAAFINE